MSLVSGQSLGCTKACVCGQYLCTSLSQCSDLDLVALLPMPLPASLQPHPLQTHQTASLSRGNWHGGQDGCATGCTVALHVDIEMGRRGHEQSSCIGWIHAQNAQPA